MTDKARNIRALLIVFVFTFFASGAAVLYWSEIAPTAESAKSATGWLKILFCYHMACWMFLGMLANYYWDLIRAGKALEDAQASQMLLPVCVAPIVFYSIWSQWGDQKIAFIMNLLAFQSGFFWHVIFSKASTTAGVVPQASPPPQATPAPAPASIPKPQ